jgi:transmembrane sensor
MTELGARLEKVRGHVQPRWSPERERRVRLALEARAARGMRWQVVSRVALAAVAVLGVAWGVTLASRTEAPEPVRIAADDTLVRLHDGSRVMALSADARVDTVEATATLTVLRLLQGTARFDVAPAPGRVFRVHARDTTVEVLGTRFVVAIEPTGTRVSVERGRVRVTGPSGEHVLAAAQSAFAPLAPLAPEVPTAEKLPAEEPQAQLNPKPVLPASPAWKGLAESGDYPAALRQIRSVGGPASNPAELLLAADVARLGGQPEQALPWLETVVRRYPSDSRAPLAAFTLGRTLLDQLGRPREAADAFATARRLAPRGALAEDALAREVESWSRSGETSRAQDRAAEYLRLYPEGRRRRAVMRYAVVN